MLNCVSLPWLRHAASLGVEKAKLPHWFKKLVSVLCSLGPLGIDQRNVIWKTRSLGTDSFGTPPEYMSLARGWIFFVKMKAIYYATAHWLIGMVIFQTLESLQGLTSLSVGTFGRFSHSSCSRTHLRMMGLQRGYFVVGLCSATWMSVCLSVICTNIWVIIYLCLCVYIYIFLFSPTSSTYIFTDIYNSVFLP